MGEALRVEELEIFRSAGRAWVTVDNDDVPVAYLLSAVLDDCAHIEQVSVTRSRARRGVGAALIEHLATIARGEGRPALTLTTFRDVPWNAPYYQRLGFTIVEPPDQGPELAVVVARETRSIPEAAPRVAMRRPLIPVSDVAQDDPASSSSQTPAVQAVQAGLRFQTPLRPIPSTGPARRTSPRGIR